MLHTENINRGKKRFSDESNLHYRYSNSDKLINKLDDLSQMIKHHDMHQRPRLKTLIEYYKGNNESILMHNRRREPHLADNRASHNFAKYVSQFIQGYLMGVPLKTTYPDDSTDELLRDINRENDADEHNSDLVLDQSVYGRAYELLYRNSDDETKFIGLDPLEAFVIYDDTVECNPIAAVRYIGKQFEEETTVFLYTKDNKLTFSMNYSHHLKLIDEQSHYFGDVPIVEYENNKYRQGDYEDVLTLIDLYDAAQSDTANYMTDLNDAMLLIKGNLEIDTDEAKEMKEANILMLQSEQSTEGRFSEVDADYIYKQYDVNGTEAYKDRIFNNILLFTSIPNLLDDKKGTGTQSGEALKMKLFALSQKRATKERLFKKSLRSRYRLLNNIMSVAAEGAFDVNEISVTFTENLPSMIDKELEWFNKAGGKLSQETLLSNLSFVENPDEEMERIEEEQDNSDLLGDQFGFADDGREEVITDGEH